MTEPRVLVTGGVPARYDRNPYLLRDVADGFAEVLGVDAVRLATYETAAAEVRSFAPSLALVCGSCLPDSCDYQPLRGACDDAGARLAFWLFDDPYEFDAARKLYSLVDVLFSNDGNATLHHDHANVSHLPLAASPRLVAGLDDVLPERDVFFCGVGFANRRRIVADLAPVLRRVKTEIRGANWDTLPFCRNESIAHERLPHDYATSRVVLNLGRDHCYANRRYRVAPSTPGPRTFEAALAGACQMLFADSLEVLDHFRLDEEIVLFNDVQDFEERLMRLLGDDARRRAIGRAARARCLRDHTYAARARTILERALPTEHAGRAGLRQRPECANPDAT